VVKCFIPEKGDLIWLEFSPQAGHEQMGRRPGLVVSGKTFNAAGGMCLVCPITNTKRKNPFRIDLHTKNSLTGYVMVDQIKSLDYSTRNAKFIEKVHPDVLTDVLGLLDAVIFQ
jgi:mRNA interferase MazF